MIKYSIISKACLISGVLFWPLPGVALPPDPERAFVAETCDAALARLHEAEAGSPLISAVEMATVVSRAQAQAVRLCGPNYDKMTDSARETAPVSKGE